MSVTIDQYFEILGAATVKAQNKMMKKAVDAMIDATPVVTGTLVEGYELLLADKNNDAEIFNDVEYFDFVNNGTIKMPPRDMIGAGLDTIPSDFTAILRNS